MIAALVRFALRQRIVVLLAALTMAAVGLWAFLQLQVEAYPDISETQVIVITLYPGHATEEIEQQVTVPIERALQSVPRAIGRRSRTIFGLSVVDVTFAYGTDDSLARQSVLEKLRDVELPDGIVPSLAPPTTPAGEIYRYVVDGTDLDEMALREIQDWVVAPRLLQVAGVGDVFAFGGLVKQYQIEVDPLALTRYDLSMPMIAAAVSANNRNAGGALLSNGQQAMVVRGVGLISSVRDIEDVVVASVNGVPVFIRDIGAVRIGPAPRTGIFGVDTNAGRVEGVVAMRRGDNPSEVLRGVRDAVADLEASLPADVRIMPIYDRTELVASTLHTVSRTLAEGLIIVTFVVLAFLCCVRAALLTAVTIPLSLLFAFGCMYASGIPANLLSLGALDLGIIVDGTLVMVVHIVRRLSARAEATPATATQAVREAAFEMERPIFVAMVIIIAAYLPLFGLERVERRLFTPMAFTVCFALIGSLLPTLTMVPALATYVFRGGALSTRLRGHVPGTEFSFTQPIIDMVTESVTGSSADLAVIFTGPDLGELRSLAARALTIVRDITGAADTSIEQDADQAQLQIRLHRQEIARYGLNVEDVQEVIELAIGGASVSTMFEGDRRFDITVRYAPEARGDVATVSRLLVPTPEGGRVPLSQLAEITVGDGASIITRRENRRQISVRTNIRGRDQGGFVAEAQRRLAAEVSLPAGYRVEWGGQFENLSRASRRLTFIVPLTIALMFGLLCMAFESAVDAGLVLVNVPFSLVGGISALFVLGIPLSVSAAVGFVSVFGVAIMTGVLFVAEVNHRRMDATLSVEDAVIQAAGARLTPNFLLILVALLGMLPAATASGIGSDIQRPMATVIVGGLLSTLLLTLVAMPSLYLLVSRRREPSRALLPIH